jgi:hypothetical protein
LINQTWSVGAPPVAVVQRLHPVFGAAVNADIDAVTRHLAAKGMVTPRLLRTDSGALWVDDEGCWRALSWVPGLTHHKLSDPALAASAGALVARWHHATDDLDHTFAFSRPLAHDTPHHMDVLRTALAEHHDHALFDAVSQQADDLLAAWDGWDGDLDQPTRLTHGDLKISNLRFDAQGQGICLLDLDTMGQLPLSVELGDAWRSWCNPAAEDSSETRFDVEMFRASARAYLAQRPLPLEQRGHLAAGVERICLELAARFLADALNESYFGWSPAVAPTRGHHNLLRGSGQLALARSAADQRSAMEQVLSG